MTAPLETADSTEVEEARARYTGSVVLLDGSTVRLRPIEPDDGNELLAFGRRLSPESLRLRFTHLPTLDAALIERLIRVDYDNSFALVGELHGRIVAVGRYTRDGRRADAAEMAFVVEDALQGKGLGSALLVRLAEVARDHGIQVIEGDVYARNHRMLNMIADSGFEVVRRISDGQVRIRLNLAPTARYEERLHARQAESAAASVRIFVEPASVAIVGASRNPAKIGSAVVQNLLRLGYSGQIYAINPAAEAIESVAVFPRLVDVPAPIDLVVIAVPQQYVDDVITDCITKKVRGVLLLTAGYSETGAAGRERENQLLSRLRSAGIRLIGPNCFGVINTDPQVRLNTSFSPIQPCAGSVSFLTQSGALGQAILDYAGNLNLGLANFISVGNKADISANDVLEFWKTDARTNVILLYLESFGNPRKFSRIAREVARLKPIVCVKSGRSRAGAKAASSHTGALAGSDRAADALFRQCGVTRTNTLEELFDAATFLSRQPLPGGPRVAILTNAGGPAIMAADACEAAGLQLAALEDRTVAELRACLPAAASVANPVDMISTADAAQYGRAMRALLGDGNVDSVLVLFVPLHPGSPERVATAIRSAVPQDCGKPVLATFLSAQGMPPELAGIPSYRFPESAVRTLACAHRYAQWRARPQSRPAEFSDFDRAAISAIIESARARGGGWLPASEISTLLRAAGIPLARSCVADSIDAALRAADSIGYPIVLKAIGPDILHKTELDAVRLNIDDPRSLKRDYEALTAQLGEAMTAVLVQQQVGKGVEVLIGATLDETFGHTIAYGMGGTMVELIGDVALRLVPLTRSDIADMLDEVRGTQLMRGYRGAPRGKESEVREIMARLSFLLECCPEIEEADFNPTIVRPEAAVVVDARVRVGTEWSRRGPRAVF